MSAAPGQQSPRLEQILSHEQRTPLGSTDKKQSESQHSVKPSLPVRQLHSFPAQVGNINSTKLMLVCMFIHVQHIHTCTQCVFVVAID